MAKARRPKNDWLLFDAAARRMGVSPRTFRRLVQLGAVVPVSVWDVGTQRRMAFAPADLDAARHDRRSRVLMILAKARAEMHCLGTTRSEMAEYAAMVFGGE